MSTLKPRRVLDMESCLKRDREQMIAIAEAERAAVAAEAEAAADAERIAEEARRMLADAQARCDAAHELVKARRREHQDMAQEIRISEVMLAAAHAELGQEPAPEGCVCDRSEDCPIHFEVDDPPADETRPEPVPAPGGRRVATGSVQTAPLQVRNGTPVHPVLGAQGGGS